MRLPGDGRLTRYSRKHRPGRCLRWLFVVIRAARSSRGGCREFAFFRRGGRGGAHGPRPRPCATPPPGPSRFAHRAAGLLFASSFFLWASETARSRGVAPRRGRLRAVPPWCFFGVFVRALGPSPAGRGRALAPPRGGRPHRPSIPFVVVAFRSHCARVPSSYSPFPRLPGSGGWRPVGRRHRRTAASSRTADSTSKTSVDNS